MSKKDRIKAKKRRERQRLEDLRKEEEMLEELEEEFEEDVAQEDEDEPEDEEPEAEIKSIEKDMGMTAVEAIDVIAGPTSWDELDAMRQAEEQAAAVRRVTWDTSDLVYNILKNPMLAPKEKATAMKGVAAGFENRVKQSASETMTKDLDALTIEAMLAADDRHTGPLSFVGDMISKAKLTYSAEQKLSDSDFALVVTRDGKKVRKYPIHDKAHVRNALARAAQQIKAGGQGAADAKAALPKIRAAAKRMGIGTSMEKDRNAIVIEKDAKGDWRWIGWVSNNFQDWDGDIISEEAHKEFVGFLDENPEYAPAFLSWHTPETVRKNRVDFWAYENGFLIMSGKLEEPEAEALLKAQTETELGMSHGTFVLRRDFKEPNVVKNYRMYEVSDLPFDKAANPFTDIETIFKEVGMNKLEYLTTILGSEELAKSYLEKTESKQKALREAEITEKEKSDEEAAPEPQAKTETTEPEAHTMEMDAVIERLKKELDIDGLDAFVSQAKEAIEKVPVLEELVKELSKTKDEQLAEVLTPPVSRFAWSQENRPSESDKTILDKTEKDKKLAESAPGIPDGYWLSQVSKTVPVQAEN